MADEAPHDTVRPEIEIGGEMFFLEEENGVLFIRHPRWSLLGSGATLREAEEDLLSEAREVAEVLLSQPIGSLAVETIAFRNFLLEII